MIRVDLSAALVRAGGGNSFLEFKASSLGEVMGLIQAGFPELHAAILTEGSFKPFVKVFADGAAVQLPADEDLILRDGCRVRIVVAVAGG